jgi:hypothetical protein
MNSPTVGMLEFFIHFFMTPVAPAVDRSDQVWHLEWSRHMDRRSFASPRSTNSDGRIHSPLATVRWDYSFRRDVELAPHGHPVDAAAGVGSVECFSVVQVGWPLVAWMGDSSNSRRGDCGGHR